MISKVTKIATERGDWYYQKFAASSLIPNEPTVFRLYDGDGDFVKEFSSYEDMYAWVTAETTL